MQNWRRYFDTHYEGLGTTYERFILHRYFARLQSDYRVESVAEVPSFGMTGISGINSMWWAARDSRVTVVDHDRERIELIREVWRRVSLEAAFVLLEHGYAPLPFDTNAFDLSWNFASLALAGDLDRFLPELARITRRVIFICLPSRLPTMYSSGTARPHINQSHIKKIMQELGWQLAEAGFMDTPPWPDIAMSKEELLKKMGLSKLAEMLESRRQDGLCVLDYFSGKNPDLDKTVLKYAFLEGLPDTLKKFWAHHKYLIFTP